MLLLDVQLFHHLKFDKFSANVVFVRVLTMASMFRISLNETDADLNISVMKCPLVVLVNFTLKAGARKKR